MQRLAARIVPSLLIVVLLSPYIWYCYERGSALMSGARSSSVELFTTVIVSTLAVLTWFAVQPAVEQVMAGRSESTERAK